MSDLFHAVNHALSNVTPYRFLTGAGIGFSGLFFFANVGANNFGLVPLISNPTLRNEFGIPIESAVRQWDWFFAKAMVSGIALKKMMMQNRLTLFYHLHSDSPGLQLVLHWLQLLSY